MMGLDTNVLVRYILQDDPAQSAAATTFIESACTAVTPGFVCHIVLVELVWVLEQGYGYNKEAIVNVLKQISTTAELALETPHLVRQTILTFEHSNAGYADCLLSTINHHYGCDVTITFDKKAAKLADFRLLAK